MVKMVLRVYLRAGRKEAGNTGVAKPLILKFIQFDLILCQKCLDKLEASLKAIFLELPGLFQNNVKYIKFI